jgi:DNA ligase (NAD+)
MIDPTKTYDHTLLTEADLFDLLTQWQDAYYNKTPLVSDAIYDQVEDYARKGFPTNAFFKKVGAAPVGGAWPKVAHGIPMGSLNKATATKDAQGNLRPSVELTTWHQGCQKPNWFAVMDKLDGGSLGLRYEGHKLVQALTRGDGTVGEDITRNARLVQGVVKQLPFQRPDGSLTPHEVFIRGEVVVTHTDFKAHFPGESNPRNTANGTIRRQSNHEKCQHLTFIAYEIIYGGANPQEKTKNDELKVLKAMGFRLPKYTLAHNLDDVEKVYREYVSTIRASLDYDIDGLVITVDQRDVRESLGDLNGRPKGAIAYKFPHEEAVTVLRNIRWQVGNSGRITPVAEFDAVNLAGANVVQASLHNISNIRDLTNDKNTDHFAVGDMIKVSRRNDVIPYVEELVTPHPTGAILTTPTECPSCKATLERDGEYLVCRNEDCEAQAAGAIKRWVKKIGVLHVGDSLIEAMCESGMVEDPADLYTLDADKVADLDMGGRRVGGTADKAVKNLEAKKVLPLHVIVGSLGIPLIGRSMAKMVVDAGFNTLSKMLKAKIPEIAAIPGMGDTKARSFVEGFQAKTWLVAKLLANGIEIQNNSGVLNGKSFCFTGFRNADLESAIEKQGGTMKSSVSKGLTYLVAADPKSTSGKAQKAAQYGTQVIGQDDAWDLVGGKV